MIDTPTPLPAIQLKSRFVKATETSTLGGSSVLSELSELARRCGRGVSPQHRIVAFVLYKLFEALSSDREERPVSVTETDELFRKAHQPVVRAIEFLMHTGDVSEAVQIASEIIDLEAELTP